MAKRGSDREPSVIEARRGQSFKDFKKKMVREMKESENWEKAFGNLSWAIGY